MSTPNDYSTDEWQAITAAPVAAGLAVAMSHWNGPTVDGNDTRTIERALLRCPLIRIVGRAADLGAIDPWSYRGSVSAQPASADAPDSVRRALQFVRRSPERETTCFLRSLTVAY